MNRVQFSRRAHNRSPLYTLRLSLPTAALPLLSLWWGKDIHTVAPKERGNIREVGRARWHYDTYYDNRSSDRLRPWVENRDIDGDGLARGIMSYDQVSQLLLNLGKNGPLIIKARDFHNGIDRLQQGGVNGVRWSALVGRGYGTLGQMREYTGLCSSWFSSYPCPKRDEIPVDGDGSVPTYSAAMGDPWSGSAYDPRRGAGDSSRAATRQRIRIPEA